MTTIGRGASLIRRIVSLAPKSVYEALTIPNQGSSTARLKLIPFIEVMRVMMGSNWGDSSSKTLQEMRYMQIVTVMSEVETSGIDFSQLDFPVQTFFKSLRILICSLDRIIYDAGNTIKYAKAWYTKTGSDDDSIARASKQVKSLFEKYEE